MTVPARLIRLLTRYPYSHVVVSLDASCEVTYSFGRRSLYNFLNGGFIVEHRDGPFFQRFSQTQCRIYRLDVTPEQHRELELYLEQMVAHKDLYRYDFLGLALRPLHIAREFDHAYVCSHFAATLLEECGVCRFDKPNTLVRPEDFEAIPGVQAVYAGPYLAYSPEYRS